MESYNLEETETCYDLTAQQYSDSLCNELDGKPFDREVLIRFSHTVDQRKPTYEFGADSCHISDFYIDPDCRTLLPPTSLNNL